MTTTATLTIQKWGNSLAVRIPAGVARSVHFAVGQEVEVATDGIGVSVRPLGQRRLNLAQRLELYDPAVHGGESMAVKPTGNEAA